jgi:hypothetical protein
VRILQTTQPLVFNWDPPRRRNLAIAGFLTASILAHAICFYVFQIVYPPVAALLPPPAHVNLINSNSEEGRTLLRWIDAEDPALASSTRRPPEAKAFALPKIQHVPSYSAAAPVLKEPPPLTVDLRLPSSQPPGPVSIPHRAVTPQTVAAPTSVVFSRELQTLGNPVFPAPKFSATTAEPPQSIRFRVAISPRGEIRHCFALNSSGDTALDEQARDYLTVARFPRTASGEDENLVWGIATIEWGNDVTHPAATSTKGTP